MNQINEKNKGLWVGLGSYFLWGFFPIYWKLLHDRGSLEILAHRFVWAFVFYLFIFFLSQKESIKLLRQLHKRELGLGLLSTLLLAVNWGYYIYAVNSGQILEGSLAYFINPILNVVVGVLFFKEKLPLVLKISILLAAIGVVFKIYLHPTFPSVALILAFSFCFYGVVKKLSKAPAGLSSVLEGFFGFFPALIFLAVTSKTSLETTSNSHWVLFIGSGVVTGLPLFLFSYAAQRIPYSVMGMMQFIAPTLQMIVGVFMFHEAFTQSHLVSFAFIWAGVGLYVYSQLIKLKSVP
ncbi:MAG: EamA family transporter RarD [Pseudobdellovibrionaceae bacterium]